jgi:integrase
MPPVLWDVLGALPEDRSGVRDRALLLVGFVGAFRRSELAAMQRSHIGAHPKGLVITIPRSKTDPYGKGQLVVLPHSSRPERCPVTSLLAWLEEAGIADEAEPEAVEEQEREGGPPVLVFRPVHRNGTTVTPRGMSEAAINDAVQRACVRAVVPQARSYSAHSLRAGFATYPAGRLGPGHRPPDPPPFLGVIGPVHQDGERLGGQRRYCAGPVKSPGDSRTI